MNRFASVLAAAALAVAPLAVTSPASAAPPAKAHFSGTVKGFGHGVCRVNKRVGVRYTQLRCPDGFKRQLAPLKSEDSRNGYWHAATRGDGVGRSFIDLRGKAYYIRIKSEGEVS